MEFMGIFAMIWVVILGYFFDELQDRVKKLEEKLAAKEASKENVEFSKNSLTP
jgi:hypothetical protein